MQNPRQRDIFVQLTLFIFAMNDIKDLLPARNRSVAFTGHRTYNAVADDELRALVRYLYEQGMTRFLCGMAWGFDLAAGRAVAELKREKADVELVAVEPFAEFRELFRAEDVAQYDAVIEAADERVVVGENDKMAYMRRNDFLVDNAAVIVAWWDGRSRGGTAYTVKRARKQRLEVVNLHPKIQLELEFK